MQQEQDMTSSNSLGLNVTMALGVSATHIGMDSAVSCTLDSNMTPGHGLNHSQLHDIWW